MMRWISLILLQFLLVSSLYYKNPIVGHTNVPDPGAVVVNGEYYVVTTSGDDPSIFPIRSSVDLVHWEVRDYVWEMNSTLKPQWAVSDFWAPEIHRHGDDWRLFFAARDTTGMLCVGVAFGPTVLGPFTDIGVPLIRNASVGNIDPTYYWDEPNQQAYVIWKEDGNGRVPPEKYTPIWAQQLEDDALGVIGDKVEILHNDPDSWEGPLVEGPWVVLINGTYYLFYSANGYAGNAYAVGVARSDNLLGPYVKFSKNPIVHTANGHWSGPGHCSVIQDFTTGNWLMIYHSWIWNQIMGPYPRVLLMDELQWTTDDWPFINGMVPSWTYQPVP